MESNLVHPQVQQPTQIRKYVDSKTSRYNNLGFINESPHGGGGGGIGIGAGENDGIGMGGSDTNHSNNSRRSKGQAQSQVPLPSQNYTPSPNHSNSNTNSNSRSNNNSNSNTSSSNNNESTLSVTNMNNFNNSNCSFSSTAVNMTSTTMNLNTSLNSHANFNMHNSVNNSRNQVNKMNQNHHPNNNYSKMGNRLTMIYTGHNDSDSHPYMGNFNVRDPEILPPEIGVNPNIHNMNMHMNMNMNMNNNVNMNMNSSMNLGNEPGPGHLGQDFLPICDSLFNVISLAAYFCDIVFDVLTAYTFYKDDMTVWSILCMFFISLSTILSQVLSFKWYKSKCSDRGKGKSKDSVNRSQHPDHDHDDSLSLTPCSSNIVIFMHLSMCGVIWRYFKLFIPVDLRFVKNEVRDLCLLRLVHAFCEAAPMLLIQLYLIWLKPGPESTTDLNMVSTALSLFSVCWALASFSKNIRRQNVHKFVLTWLGVIFQFLWRLGTVTSRVIALSVYATIYTYWLFLVIFLHWFSMLLWLISPKNIFHGEKMSTIKKVWYSTLIAVVYVFCYVNVQESNSRQKLIIFYVTMFLENTLLFCVWLIAVRNEEFWFKELATSLVFAGFMVGIAFMCLYYRYFHPTKLSYADESGTTSTYRESHSSANCNGIGPGHNHNYGHSNGGHGIKGNISGGEGLFKCTGNKGAMTGNGHVPYGHGHSNYNKMNGGHHHANHHVRGVFNCQFHPAMKRKKKKPTSFVPPPAVPKNNKNPQPNNEDNENENAEENESPNESFLISPSNKSHPMRMSLVNMGMNMNMHMNMGMNMNGKMSNPFWKRPLSITLGSENEGSVGSRVDIQQKLQEKKQQQLAELREIEEEIKQGKLKRPHISEFPEPVSERQPIPFEKKQPWSRADPPVQLSPRPPILIPPSDPNEFVLDPAYLMYSAANGGFYEQPDWNYYEPLYQNDVEVNGQRRQQPQQQQQQRQEVQNQGISRGSQSPSHNMNPNPSSRDSIYKSYRIPSDIDSQMSLPRSYTLPREFKYRRKMRKPVKTENFLPSTNSSDADVDSGGEDPETYSHLRPLPYPLPLPSVHQVHMPNSGSGSGQQGKRYVGSRRHRNIETKL